MRSNTDSPLVRFAAILTSLSLAALFIVLYAGFARAEGINVEIDQAKLLRLNRPGAEVIVGNPSIADVSVRSNKLLVVTGKSAGLTNMMVLDAAGDLIYSEKLFVSADTKRLVTVNKGKARATYSCSPHCSPALIPGDTTAHFDPLSKEIRNKLGLAQSAADGTTSQQ